MHRKHSTDAANKKKNDHTHCPADPEDCVLSQFYLYAQTNLNRIPRCVVGYYRESAGPNPPKLSVPWRAESETTTILFGDRYAVHLASGLGIAFPLGIAASVEVTAFLKLLLLLTRSQMFVAPRMLFGQLHACSDNSTSSVRFGSNIKSFEERLRFTVFCPNFFLDFSGFFLFNSD